MIKNQTNNDAAMLLFFVNKINQKEAWMDQRGWAFDTMEVFTSKNTAAVIDYVIICLLCYICLLFPKFSSSTSAHVVYVIYVSIIVKSFWKLC